MEKILFTLSKFKSNIDFSKELPTQIKVIDIKENIERSMLYRVRKVPTLVIDMGPSKIKKVEGFKNIELYLKK